jgi:hypothetical protein
VAGNARDQEKHLRMETIGSGTDSARATLTQLYNLFDEIKRPRDVEGGLVSGSPTHLSPHAPAPQDATNVRAGQKRKKKDEPEDQRTSNMNNIV